MHKCKWRLSPVLETSIDEQRIDSEVDTVFPKALMACRNVMGVP